MQSLLNDSFSFSEVKIQIETLLKQRLDCFGIKTPLRDACEYALMNGGKRIRPLIVFMTAKALNKQLDVSNAALSVEYFHTASLIADDLPCMDNDDFRREKPSVHKIFGEATALLASYALITAAFEKVYESAKQHAKESGELCLMALFEASKAAGIHGATGGQYLDLYPGTLSLKGIKTIIEKKTITLFEISFLYGWIFGGGGLEFLSEVKKLGYHFGMAFQIADDLRDCFEDQKRNNPANLALYLGKEKALELFNQEKESFISLLDKLGIKTAAFVALKIKLEQHAIGK
jgi:geranylgeranyl diphosphate synthase, type II